MVALDELTRAPWTSLQDYASVRGIEALEAARRNLFRLRDTLREHGVALEIKQTRRRIAARFGTPEIAELIEPDVRVASKLVEQQRRESEGELLDSEDEGAGIVIAPETISVEYRTRAKNFTWIARKHGIGKERLRRILVSTGAIRAPRLRRRVEERRPAALVVCALDAADRGVPLDEICSILDCSPRTARRFLRRYGRTLPLGRRPRHDGA